MEYIMNLIFQFLITKICMCICMCLFFLINKTILNCMKLPPHFSSRRKRYKGSDFPFSFQQLCVCVCVYA